MKRVGAMLLAAVLAMMLAVPGAALEVTEDISVSDDYDWQRLAGQNVTLNVYNWGMYISDGSDDSADVLSAFEELTGIRVNYTTFDTNESLYAKLKSGGASYDVVVPSDYMIGKMAAEGMLEELDYSMIPNIADVDEQYLSLSYDPENLYAVPYTWGTVGIVYNTSMVDEEVTSWDILWDADYAGDILMFNNSRDAFAIAAKRMGMSLNPSSQEEIDLTVASLKEQKLLVQAYVMDEIFDKMEGGEAAVAPYYAGDALLMMEENPDLAFVIPEEGTNFFVDCMCIPKGAKNKEAAEMFINYMCETDVGMANCDYIGYGTPLTSVWENLDDEIKYNEIAYPAAEVLANTEVFQTLPDDINAAMDAAWSEMKSYDEDGGGWLIPIVLLVCVVIIVLLNVYRYRKRTREESY